MVFGCVNIAWHDKADHMCPPLHALTPILWLADGDSHVLLCQDAEVDCANILTSHFRYGDIGLLRLSSLKKMLDPGSEGPCPLNLTTREIVQ